MAFALPLITALMLVQPVSAADVIYDPAGDTPVWSWGKDGTPFTTLSENSNPPMVRVGYFDMIEYSLSLEGDHYRFWMKVLVDLPVPDPEVGDVFPEGLEAGQWVMYIDPGPYNPVYNPVISLFLIGLRCDDRSQYSAFLFDYATGEETALEPGSYGYSGPELWIEFPKRVIEDYETETLWWAAGTKAVLGTSQDNTAWDWRIVDFTEYDAELATWDIAWPEV